MVVAAVDIWRERVLGSVSTRAVAAIVAQRDRLGERDVGSDGTSDCCGHLGHLERMGQPGALVVLGEHEHLGLPRQAPERIGMQDPVTVTLEAGPVRIRFLVACASTCSHRKGCTGRQGRGLPFLALLPT